ncbi:MAG: FKBP-type peptidyl-prolyl cis-trans isomerase [Lachnospiraceae bacterium]|nr:FKBP-type peptidyl-prolyl cis-trans isomerase [Lachnospiraceae bacterium]
MSSDKREAQKRNREQAMKKAETKKGIKAAVIIGIVLIVLAGVGFGAWYYAGKAVTNTKPVKNLSEGLNDDGSIANVKALDYVDLCDYKNMTAPKSEVEPTDEEINEQIDALLALYPITNTDTSRRIKSGDTINLDYVGSIDGVEFEGGNTMGAGTSLTIGSGAYIPGFEDAIIGHSVGENFDIFVTFPETYAKAELAGQEAKFNITVNSVQEKPELTDEFVAANLSDIATTADGLKEHYASTITDKKLTEYISEYLKNNSKVNEYPKKYLEVQKGIIKNDDMATYEYYKSSMGNSFTFEEYIEMMGIGMKEYEAALTTQAMNSLDSILIMQAVCEDGGIVCTEEDVATFLSSYGLDSSYINAYESQLGKGYLYQAGTPYAAVKYVKQFVTVVEQ